MSKPEDEDYTEDEQEEAKTLFVQWSQQQPKN